MTARCPECGTRFGAPRGAEVLPCPRCGNPVGMPVRRPAPRPAAAAPGASRGESPGDAAEPAPQVPWLLAAAVAGVLILAHYALYLVITAEARADASRLEAEFGRTVTAPLADPGASAPPANSPRYRTWHAARTRFEASRAWADHEAHRSLVATGLTISLLIQLGITAFALARLRTRLARAGPRPGRA